MMSIKQVLTDFMGWNPRSNITTFGIRWSLDLISLISFLLVFACSLLGRTQNTLFSLLLLVGFSVLVFKPEYLIGPVFITTLFDEYMIAFNGQSFSRFCTLFLIIGVVLDVIVQRRRIRHLVMSFIVLLLLLLGILLSLYPAFPYTSFPLSYTLNVILLLSMMNLVPMNEEVVVKQLLWYSILGVLLIVSLVVLRGGSVLDAWGGRLSIDTTVNPNLLAMAMAQMVAVLVSTAIVGQCRVQNYIITAVLLVGIVLTGSRTGLIAAAGCIIVASIISIFMFGSSPKKAISARKLMIIPIVFFVSYLVLELTSSELLSRFSIRNILATGGSNRLDIWNTLLTRVFPKRFLLGIGFDPRNAFYAVEAYHGIGHGSHNIVVEILIKTGVIGAIMYLIFFIKVFRNVLKKVSKYAWLLVPTTMLASILFNGIGEDVLTTRFLWFSVGLIFTMLNGSHFDVNRPSNDIGTKAIL